MTAREQERLARRLHRIARRGGLASPKRFYLEAEDRRAPTFYELSGAIQDAWRHLAGWLWMDTRHVLKGVRHVS